MLDTEFGNDQLAIMNFKQKRYTMRFTTNDLRTQEWMISYPYYLNALMVFMIAWERADRNPTEWTVRNRGSNESDLGSHSVGARSANKGGG